MRDRDRFFDVIVMYEVEHLASNSYLLLVLDSRTIVIDNRDDIEQYLSLFHLFTQ